MEPKKESESYGNLPNRFNNERIKDIVEINKPLISEKTSSLSGESTVSSEKPPLSELIKMEMKDNQTMSTAAGGTIATNDPAYQTISATVDPQDQLSTAEIEENKKGPVNNALTWLAVWWDRQLKQLTNKKTS